MAGTTTDTDVFPNDSSKESAKTMNAPLTFRLGSLLGTGAYGHVFTAIEVNSGRMVALKKSRVSQRVTRPILLYESRVLQLLQGHPGIPVVYGYGQLPHFEYLAMEHLGPSIKARRPNATARVPVKTVLYVVEQALSALQHIHTHGLVHRDIKPENFLCSQNDPSKIMLIDFNTAYQIKTGPPRKYDPLAESRHIVGTLHWASINAHDGIDLAPRDDLESLAYTILFLLHGNLPWRSGGSSSESIKHSMQRIRASKTATSGATLGEGFPSEFGDLLDYSRGLEFDQMPDYKELNIRFSVLAERLGCVPGEPFDWAESDALEISKASAGSDKGDRESNDDGDDGDDGGDDNDDIGDDDELEEFSNSYFDWDIADWDIHGERDRDLTLPVEQKDLADRHISEIVHVMDSR